MNLQNDALKSLNPGLQKIITEKGWKSGFTEIQLKAIPVILAGNDCIIEAPTAGGKTEAVLFPALSRVASDKKQSVQLLYIAPLRALLNNIEIRAIEYSAACGLQCFKWHGDVSQNDKIKEFNNPPQVLLTTPESLEAILLRKSGWEKFFRDLMIVVIDEAHNFAYGDRGGHLVTLLERLEKSIGFFFQRIALTATVGNPHDLLNWMGGLNRKSGQRVFTTSPIKKVRDFKVHFFDRVFDNGSLPANMSHIRQFITLYKLLPNKKAIVFGNSRTKTEELASAVGKMNEKTGASNPVKVRTHHSCVSKYFREEAEMLIQVASESGLQAIISTSTLELGIDIGELDQIIQIGSLTSSSAFLQRVGRTGRREGKAQFFRGLCTTRNDLVLLTAVINLGLKGISEAMILPRRAYHLLAHQLICMSLQKNGISVDDAWNYLSSAYCFSGISRDKFIEMVQTMIQKNYLRNENGILIIDETVEKEFLGSNWLRLFATFDSAPMYDVIEGKSQVGTLSSSFVEALTVPFLFVLGGIEWEAQKIDQNTRQVIARRTKIGNAPKWEVFGGGDIPWETAKEAGRILMGNNFPEFLDKEARNGLEAERNEHRNLDWNEENWIIGISDSGMAQIWTFAGDKINRTISLLFQMEKAGKSASNYNRVSIASDIKDQKKLSRLILNVLETFKEMNPEQMIEFEKNLAQGLRKCAFSKFSKCLPPVLWCEAMSERILDITGLKSELMNKNFLIKTFSFL